jgi:hypothetical protein
MKDFGQQRLKGATNWSATKGGRVCIDAAVPYCGCILIPPGLVGRSVSWSVGPSVSRSTTRLPGLWEVSLQKDKGSRALGVSLQKENPSYIECARYSCNILLIYVKV